MKAEIISFTDHGALLAQRLAKELPKEHISCRAWVKKRNAVPPDGVRVLSVSLKEWTCEQFSGADILIFIGAAGIAVRSIAPFVQSKKTDPAVLAADEQGKHVISLLSGHMGGANAVTRLVAEILHAEPVITTATDLHGKFAVDAFAAQRGCIWIPWSMQRRLRQSWWPGDPWGCAAPFRYPERYRKSWI